MRDILSFIGVALLGALCGTILGVAIVGVVNLTCS